MRKILVQALGTFSTPGQPIPRNFQKSRFLNFSGLSTENLYMCPVSTLAGRFFSEKTGLSFKKPIYVSCKRPRGAFFSEKKLSFKKPIYVSCKHPRGAFFSRKKTTILVFSAPARAFFLLKNSNLCPERPHRPPEAPGSDLGAHPAPFLSIFDGRVVKY